jgi:hypothetical protein
MLTRDRDSCDNRGVEQPFAARHNRRQPIRRPIDDFDLGLERRGGRSHDDESVELGRRITFVFGEENQAVQTYELLLGYAPPRDLEALCKRGAIIVMAEAKMTMQFVFRLQRSSLRRMRWRTQAATTSYRQLWRLPSSAFLLTWVSKSPRTSGRSIPKSDARQRMCHPTR